MNIPELLAPAGNMETLKTAVHSGADAVYFGAMQFSARAHAGNFDAKEAAEAIQYCHAHKVLAYVALNTLILNHEVDNLIQVATRLAADGVDAFIVQDLGVAHLINRCLPEIPLHASTQMVIHNAEGVAQLAEWGFERVVLARESHLDDIRYIHAQHDMALEIFVHGAQCVCYSGACLLSSFSGGRSGNRGDCAQPCRKTYALQTEKGEAVETVGDHLLSPKDMDVLAALPDLAEAGVRSLKIEGRMKNATYVAATTGAYRWALDRLAEGEIPKKDAIAEKVDAMARIFNRGGFTTGYLRGNPGKDLMFYPTPKNLGVAAGQVKSVQKSTFTVQASTDLHLGDGYVLYDADFQPVAGGYINRMIDAESRTHKTATAGSTVQIDTGTGRLSDDLRFYRTYDKALVQRFSDASANPKPVPKEAVDFYVEAIIGKPLRLTAVTETMATATVDSDYVVQKAERKATTQDDMMKPFGRLGDTAFTLRDVYLHGDAEIFVPTSVLNELRRQSIAKLQPEEAPCQPTRPIVHQEEKMACCYDLLDHIPPSVRYDKPVVYAAQVATLAQAEAALAAGCNRLIIDLTDYRGMHRISADDLAALAGVCRKKDVVPVVTMSPIWHHGETEAIEERLQAAKTAGIDAISIQNAGHITLAKAIGFREWIADIGMNITNDVAIRALLATGFERVTLSPELSLAEMSAFTYLGNIKTALVVYGDMPLMQSAYCPVGAVAGGRSDKQTCAAPCSEQRYHLIDDLGNRFDLLQDAHCRSYLFDHRVLDGVTTLDLIRESGIDEWRFLFLRHTPDEIKTVLAHYRAVATGEAEAAAVTSRPRTLGHLLQGVKH